MLIYSYFKNKIKKIPLRRFLFLLIILIFYKIGNFIPVPGINIFSFKKNIIFNGNFISIFNVFSGIIISNFSIFSLGIMPYISSSIFVQLLTLISTRVKLLKKEGEAGYYKIIKLTKYITIIFSFIQSFFVLLSLILKKNIILHPGFLFYVTLIISFVTGTSILMWISEQISEYGLGNGISIIIFCSIITSLHHIFNIFFFSISLNIKNFFFIFLFFLILLLLILIIVFIEKGQRKIYLNYINRQISNKIFYSKYIHLPLKLNISGVIPVIFSSTIITFPSILISWFLPIKSINFLIVFLKNLNFLLLPGKKMYVILHIFLIMLFCFLYSPIIFNSYEISENLKKNGTFIIGYRPGYHTSKYINNILMYLTFWGSLYISIIYLLPQILILFFNYSFYFSGTSLLIIVLVVIEFIEQIQCYIMDNKNNSLLKNFKYK